MPDPADRATDSLVAHAQGDPRAAEDLLPLVYDELRALAAAYMADERLDHTLQPTALEKPRRVSPLESRIVELMLFGGLSMDETAAVLGVGRDRVRSDWRFARAWLKRELSEGEAAS